MTQQNIIAMPKYFDKYVQLVPIDTTLSDALRTYSTDYLAAHLPQMQALADRVYAPSKWTAKDILQHIIDAERVFVYRALRIARHDATPMEGFDENVYAAHATAATAARSLDSLVAEFDLLRRSNIAFFEALPPAALLYEGTASNNKISVLALGFVLCGHLIHHLQVLESKYYNLL